MPFDILCGGNVCYQQDLEQNSSQNNKSRKNSGNKIASANCKNTWVFIKFDLIFSNFAICRVNYLLSFI